MCFEFRCPVCGNSLHDDGKTLKCDNNHSFDISSRGYVNLLQSQQSSKKRHGDDKLMVKARQEFLDKGYYNCLLTALLKKLDEYKGKNVLVADLGCGECWYTSEIYNCLNKDIYSAEICGIDISKDALIAGAKRCKNLKLAVGSISNLPIQDNSCDIVVSIFAPHDEKEIQRVLKKSGVWFKVFPLEKHLMGLKSIIYDNPYENDVDRQVTYGFSLVERHNVEDIIKIECNEDILNLFKMTPYYYKTSAEDQSKIHNLNTLETNIQFCIEILAKIVQ